MSNFAQLPAFPYDVPPKVMDLAKQVRLALFDVDGVLTDGRLQYSEQGEALKTFHALDGHGLKMLRMVGVEVGIISARDSGALRRRLTDLGIKHQHLGVHNKLDVFNQLLKELALPSQQVAFTGDDVIDLPVMLECGLKFSVENGHFIVKHLADWVTPLCGGTGAVRAICDLLLYSREQYPLGAAPQQ